MRKVERPIVVKLKRSKGVVVQDCDVYIGRRQTQGGWRLQDSEWGNPFTVKTHGDKCIELYRQHLIGQIREDPDTMIIKLASLEGKVLGCWCLDGTPGKTCHGTVIADFVVMVCESELDDGKKFLEAVWGDEK